MPSVTVKAFAELIHTPLYGQLRILHDHKYPDQEPGVFKIQYYRPALRMIRDFYNSSNDITVLATTASDITGVGRQPHQRTNNFRAISAFRNGKQVGRAIRPGKALTWDIVRDDFSVRCTPDLCFSEHGHQGMAMVDCREQAPDKEVIQTTLELLHLALQENGLELPMKKLEYIHLESDKVYSWLKPRKITLGRLTKTLSAIDKLWDTI